MRFEYKDTLVGSNKNKKIKETVFKVLSKTINIYQQKQLYEHYCNLLQTTVTSTTVPTNGTTSKLML